MMKHKPTKDERKLITILQAWLIVSRIVKNIRQGGAS